MNKNLYVLVSLSCVIVMLALFGIKEATAICTSDILEDWPDAPCGLPLSTEKLREDWQGYYKFKGKEWMEEKRTEMENAIHSGTLEQWRSYGSNHNVWLYYKITNNVPEVPPLKQFRFGIPITEIKCKENLTLLKKTNSGLPICVSIKTGQKMLERKWAQPMASTAPLESMKKSDSKNTNEPYSTIEISFGNLTKSKLLPVVFSEITHNAEYLNEILVWNFELIGHNADDRRKTWDVIPKDQRVFYKITDEHGTDVIDKTRMPDNWGIPDDLHLYSMDCGLFRTVDGESAHPTVFAVNKGTSTIIAKNSNKGILPISDGKYSFESASMFETTVKLPKNAEIISQESKQCKLVQGIEGDPDRTYVDGYYTKMVFRLEN